MWASIALEVRALGTAPVEVCHRTHPCDHQLLAPMLRCNLDLAQAASDRSYQSSEGEFIDAAMHTRGPGSSHCRKQLWEWGNRPLHLNQGTSSWDSLQNVDNSEIKESCGFRIRTPGLHIWTFLLLPFLPLPNAIHMPLSTPLPPCSSPHTCACAYFLVTVLRLLHQKLWPSL